MNRYENIFRRLVKLAVNGELAKLKLELQHKPKKRSCKGGKRGIKVTPSRYVKKFVRLMGITSNLDECWEWKGAARVREYGGMRFYGKQWLAPRLALLFSGKDPTGKCACHHCDNPKCVNPRHIFIGTMADNLRDMFEKGRGNRPKGEDNCKCTTSLATVLAIRKEYASGLISQKHLAEKYNVTQNTVCLIVNRYSWKHV